MGYRSEVRCLIYGPPDKLAALWAKHRLTNHENLETFKEHVERYKFRHKYGADEGAIHEMIHLHCDDVKWYENYPDVTAWMELMRDAPEFGCNYEFIRVGEDRGDIEAEEDGEAMVGMMYTTTPTIQFDDDYLVKLTDEKEPTDDTNPEG